MLTEHCVVSLFRDENGPTSTALKDAGIFVSELQPTPTVRSVLKKSSVKANCLAVSSTHVFAAQANRAVVHVYNIEKGNQEATIPLAERATSLEHVGQLDGPGALAIGTEGGRLLLWEV